MEERIQKIIARAGIASRRRAEEMMTSGMVTVNGNVVTELGTKADASRDHIKVAGKLIQPEMMERVYLVLHKPPEVVSTLSDPEGRSSLRDLLYGISERVFPVGRLEYHASGLVFLTNDGDLANRILQAHNLPQTYQLKVKTLLTFDEIASLSNSTGARITRLRGKDTPWYEVTLPGTRSDALRNKLFKTGHLVEKVKRTRIANIELDSLPPGAHRPLRPVEIAELKQALDAQPVGRKAELRKPDERKPEWRDPAWPKPESGAPVNHTSGGPEPAWQEPHTETFEPMRLEAKPVPIAPALTQRADFRSAGGGKPAWKKQGSGKPFTPNRPEGVRSEGKRDFGKRPWQKPAGRDRPDSRAAGGNSAWKKPEDRELFAPGRTEDAPPEAKREFGKRPWQKPARRDRPNFRAGSGKPAWKKPENRKPFTPNRVEGTPPEGKREYGKRPWQKPAGGDRPDFRASNGKPAWKTPGDRKPFAGKPAWKKSGDRKPFAPRSAGGTASDGRPEYGSRPRPAGGDRTDYKPARRKPVWKSEGSKSSQYKPAGRKPAGRKPASRRPPPASRRPSR